VGVVGRRRRRRRRRRRKRTTRTRTKRRNSQTMTLFLCWFNEKCEVPGYKEVVVLGWQMMAAK
jgi:hypothetical protein